LLTLIPSLSNSPRILSAPHVELLDAIERNQRAGLGGEALCGARSAPPAPQGPEAGAMRAKKRLGLDDAQRIPPRRRQGPASATNTIRSSRVTLGLATDRCRMATWWRS
jgi:hypothetical protein